MSFKKNVKCGSTRRSSGVAVTEWMYPGTSEFCRELGISRRRKPYRFPAAAAKGEVGREGKVNLGLPRVQLPYEPTHVLPLHTRCQRSDVWLQNTVSVSCRRDIHVRRGSLGLAQPVTKYTATRAPINQMNQSINNHIEVFNRITWSMAGIELNYGQQVTVACVHC